MEFKDYYSRLGLEKTATPEQIKRAYRKLARKYHPDVSKEPDAEAQFKAVAEAYEALKNPELRAAYDTVGSQHSGGKDFRPPPDWDNGFEFTEGAGAQSNRERSDFFETLFRRATADSRGRGAPAQSSGDDHHAKVQIDLAESYRGGRRTISLQLPVRDEQGHLNFKIRQLEVNIPKGVRSGQHLRLKGQGGAGHGTEPAGDLYLEVQFAPHRLFRADGCDVYVDLPVAPWEAALGASVTMPTPDGNVQVSVPAGSPSGRRLRLRGKGLPTTPPGDLYAVLSVVLPPAGNDAAQAAYRALASSFGDFNPRAAMKG